MRLAPGTTAGYWIVFVGFSLLVLAGVVLAFWLLDRLLG